MSAFHSNMLLGSVAETADLGDPIEQSLRFTQDINTTLSKSNFSGTDPDQWTVSYWIKLTGESTTVWTTFGSLTGSYYVGHGGYVSGNQYTQWAYSDYLDTILRDPSAWYHVVHQWNNPSSQRQYRTYVNGNLIQDINISWPANPLFMTPGGTNYIPNTPAIGNFGGYIADFYAIDGSVLSPSTFARTNADGVWVPKTPTISNYGTNGFHLTFDPSQDTDPLVGIGIDSSGQGNHFTATGLNAATAATYSGQLTTTNASGFSTTYPATNAFDGSTATYVTTVPVAGTISFTPTTPIPYTSSVRIYHYHYQNDTYTFNNQAYTTNLAVNGYGWETIATGSGTFTEFTMTSGTGNYLYAIEIDGTILTDSFGFNEDVVDDTPTSNRATLNPLLKPNSPTLSDGNLTSYSGSTYISFATQAPDYKYYWESKGSNYYYGIANIDYDRSTYLGLLAHEAGLYNNGDLYVSGAVVSNNTPLSYTTTDIIMQAYDPATGNLWFGKNGTWSGDPSAGTSPLYTVPAAYRDKMVPASNPAGAYSTHNFGQQTFSYTVPTGFKALAIENLSEPTIKDGSDHFRVLTGFGNAGGTLYTENDIATSAPATVTYPLGTLTDPLYSTTSTSVSTPTSGSTFTWVWDAGGPISTATITWLTISGTQTYAYSLDGQTWFGQFQNNNLTITFNPGQQFRYIRKRTSAAGGMTHSTSQGLPIVSAAQTAFPSGLWWIKDMDNSNQHQLVDSLRGTSAIQSPAIVAEQTYSPPSGNCVAWCWNYDSSNPGKNGFDIVTYTGNGQSNRAINHNLGKAPEFMLVKNRDEAYQITAYHSSEGPTKFAFLNTNAAFNTDSTIWSNTAPTATQFTVGNNILTNGDANGDDMIAYLWTSVPGYSAFGSYAGNSDADGPFIYTGFRPAFVMIKSTSGYNWTIVDSTRNTYNPIDTYLFPNQQLANDGPYSTYHLDFVSNGFKLRNSSATDTNYTGNTYIYAAFAENPFGGENTAPVTAR